MPDDEQQAVLRIHAIGGVTVQQVQSCLSSIEHSYNAAYLFESITNQLFSEAKAHDRIVPYDRFYVRQRLRSFIYFGRQQIWNDYSAPSEIRAMIPVGSHLILKSVTLHSPGAWEFLGKLNPLEVLRLYLNDRHERRKDFEYREDAESEKLQLENELLKTKVYREKLQLLREMGLTDEEMSELKNGLLHEPLDRLGAIQDRRLIEAAEIVKESPENGPRIKI